MLRLRGLLFLVKTIHKKEEKNERDEEKGRSSGHKLNITNIFTDKIIPSNISSVILLIKNITSPYNLSI